LLSAFRSSSSEAEAPPSKKPACVVSVILFVWVWRVVGLQFACVILVEIDWMWVEVRPRYCIILIRDSLSAVRWLKSEPEFGTSAFLAGVCLAIWRLSFSSSE
jgi:hypothetical protein